MTGSTYNGSTWVAASVLSTTGMSAYYWSYSSFSTANAAFNFHIDGATVGPSFYSYRYTGFPLRCLYAS